MVKNIKNSRVILIIIVIMLSGCTQIKQNTAINNNNDNSNSWSYTRNASRYSQKHDSYPDPKILPDLRLIKEPVPKYEPKSRYGNPVKYTVLNKTYTVLNSSKHYSEKGVASWYGTKFHGHRTSSGEIYNMYAMTAAHKTLPLPTYARVTNLANRRSVIVKINDRGPFCNDRIVDLSYAAASKIGILANGVGEVEVVAINPKEYQRGLATPVVANSSLDSDSLQLGAFKVQHNANKLAKQLQKILQNHYGSNQQDYQVSVVEHNLQNQDKENILYKVTVNALKKDPDLNKLKSILYNLTGKD